MPESPLIGAASSIPCLVESVLKDPNRGVPRVTVSWAQSIDGSIAAADGKPVALSGPEALALTHTLRAMHRAILVGIGTVLMDDPRLTVRLVHGRSPLPVVLDSSLRFPLGARLLARKDCKPWIFHARGAPAARVNALSLLGARLLALPDMQAGLLPLLDVLRSLGSQGIESVMVEGGARVVRSFIAGGLAHQAVITMSPARLEGIRIFDRGRDPSRLPDFVESSQEKMGLDIVTWGRFSASALS